MIRERKRGILREAFDKLDCEMEEDRVERSVNIGKT